MYIYTTGRARKSAPRDDRRRIIKYYNTAALQPRTKSIV